MTWDPPQYPQQPPGPPPPPFGGNPYPPNPYGPPPGAPQWPSYSYSPRPTRRSNGWIIAAVAGGLVLVVLIVAAVSVWQRNTSGAKNATSQYLTDLESEQYAAAYQMLCPADLLAVPESTFIAAKTADHPLSFAIGHVAVAPGSGSDYASVYYTESRSDGWSGTATIRLVKTGGVWQPCHGGAGGSWLNQSCGCTSATDFHGSEPGVAVMPDRLSR